MGRICAVTGIKSTEPRYIVALTLEIREGLAGVLISSLKTAPSGTPRKCTANSVRRRLKTAPLVIHRKERRSDMDKYSRAYLVCMLFLLAVYVKTDSVFFQVMAIFGAIFDGFMFYKSSPSTTDPL